MLVENSRGSLRRKQSVGFFMPSMMNYAELIRGHCRITEGK